MKRTMVTENGQTRSTWELTEEEVTEALRDYIEASEFERDSNFFLNQEEIKVTLFEATGRMCEGKRPITFITAIVEQEKKPTRDRGDTMTLTEALKALPDTPEAIADFLLEKECKGNRSNGVSCPLANYFHKQTGEMVTVAFGRVHKTSKREDGELCTKLGETIELSDAAHEFYNRFDDGDFSDLQEKKGD